MRLLRVFLLLLLVALLPLRGSLAATMLCHEGMPHEEVQAAEHMHAHAGPATSDHHHDASGSADKCNLCAGLTSPACPFTAIAEVTVAPVHSQLVPQPTLWPASFFAARLKRPPRAT